ncbi:pyruvate dehydrogenase complex dihydrolipoamide acetyltransferase [Aquisediminimonas profunda]|uniref:pyruvate dehydrogenase complex dihydrolipoamide acetyltransferase n=1 Tax=Aquisediminimonas profunda TaxID=1550733 RepID=UPI001C62BCE7|nr:pyruvate dehydrogenase complex dihydrolipoamide acetyltransferase [Aquisediminimonas profunda]
MLIELRMPALSPTMEEGTLAKWLVKQGDEVKSGDLLAEIETDKATMEFEAVDEGTISSILVPPGTEGVKVGTVIALISAEGDDVNAKPAPKAEAPKAEAAPTPPVQTPSPKANVTEASGDRIIASPLARRLAATLGIDLSKVKGTGPNGRIVKADIEEAPQAATASATVAVAATSAPQAPAVQAAAKPVWFDDSIPHEIEKLSNIRKTIARRLTEAKQTIPHIYLTVDIRLDALLKLRAELNAGLESRGIKLSVNDLLIKALAVALEQTPKCNVTFLGNEMVSYKRADISVAVSTPSGLITPIIRDAANLSVSRISNEMKELAARAKEGKLQPHEYQGGTASLSNMGMYGIKQFEAVINPPQGMILAIGAGEKRPFVVDDALAIATVMSATGSFDHRAIDGSDGAQLMQVFKDLVEKPLGMMA